MTFNKAKFSIITLARTTFFFILTFPRLALTRMTADRTTVGKMTFIGGKLTE
jgi:hypothetical protein